MFLTECLLGFLSNGLLSVSVSVTNINKWRFNTEKVLLSLKVIFILMVSWLFQKHLKTQLVKQMENWVHHEYKSQMTKNQEGSYFNLFIAALLPIATEVGYMLCYKLQDGTIQGYMWEIHRSDILKQYCCLVNFVICTLSYCAEQAVYCLKQNKSITRRMPSPRSTKVSG